MHVADVWRRAGCVVLAAILVAGAQPARAGQRTGTPRGASHPPDNRGPASSPSPSPSPAPPSAAPTSKPAKPQPFTSAVFFRPLLKARRTPPVGSLFGVGAYFDPLWWSDWQPLEARDDSSTASDVPIRPLPAMPPESSSIQPQQPVVSPSGSRGITGTVRLDIVPQYAQVYVDGFYAGPVERLGSVGLRLGVGWHRLEIRAPGCETAAVNVTVEAERATTVHLALRSLQ